jgi:hypothetical protein
LGPDGDRRRRHQVRGHRRLLIVHSRSPRPPHENPPLLRDAESSTFSHQISLGDDTNNPAVTVHDRRCAHVAPNKSVHDLPVRTVRTYGNHIAGHDIPH